MIDIQKYGNDIANMYKQNLRDGAHDFPARHTLKYNNVTIKAIMYHVKIRRTKSRLK